MNRVESSNTNFLDDSSIIEALVAENEVLKKALKINYTF